MDRGEPSSVIWWMAEASGGIGTGGRTRSDPMTMISPPTRSTAPISTTASFAVVPVVSRSTIRKWVGLSDELAMPYLACIPQMRTGCGDLKARILVVLQGSRRHQQGWRWTIQRVKKAMQLSESRSILA